MFDTLLRLLRLLVGRDHLPPFHPEQKQAGRGPDNPGYGQSERPEDRPTEDWADRVNRPPAGGDWLRERLRSLPDEEKGREPEGRERRRVR